MSFQKFLIIGLMLSLSHIPVKAENRLSTCQALSNMFCHELTVKTEANLSRCALSIYKMCLKNAFDTEECMEQLGTTEGAINSKNHELLEKDIHFPCRMLFPAVKSQYASKNTSIDHLASLIKKELNNKDWGPITSGEDALLDLTDNPKMARFQLTVTGKTTEADIQISHDLLTISVPFSGSYTRIEPKRKHPQRPGGNFSGTYYVEYRVRGEDIKLKEELITPKTNSAVTLLAKSIKQKLKEIVE